LFDIFADVKQVIDSKNFKLTSRIPTLWGNINGEKFAGTIDLLAIDPEGNVYIIDLKTSSQNRRDTEGKYYQGYRDGDKIQQSAYAELLRQRTGITVKNIVIFPVQVTIEENVYNIAEMTMVSLLWV
jgi:ATP-dependent exoDNAse (exonuclease V) beta subunit